MMATSTVLTSTGSVDGGSSGSNSAAGTAIGVILILAFLAVVGFIVYKKYFAKKTVIVSGVDMTSTPRMSRKGSYKGVVGSKPEYPVGSTVDEKDDDEVVGEEDEETLEGDEDEDEGEEEEMEVDRANRARRAV